MLPNPTCPKHLRSRFIAVRLTAGELEALDSIQAVNGLESRSETVRQLIDNNAKPVRSLKESLINQTPSKL